MTESMNIYEADREARTQAFETYLKGLAEALQLVVRISRGDKSIVVTAQGVNDGRGFLDIENVAHIGVHRKGGRLEFTGLPKAGRPVFYVSPPSITIALSRGEGVIVRQVVRRLLASAMTVYAKAEAEAAEQAEFATAVKGNMDLLGSGWTSLSVTEAPTTTDPSGRMSVYTPLGDDKLCGELRDIGADDLTFEIRNMPIALARQLLAVIDKRVQKEIGAK